MIKLLILLIAIESGGDSKAIGDGGRAVGILQIHPIMIRECNRITGRKRWTLADRLDPVESVKMCTLYLSYQRARKPEAGLVELGCSWNSGSIMKPLPKKYRAKLRE